MLHMLMLRLRSIDHACKKCLSHSNRAAKAGSQEQVANEAMRHKDEGDKTCSLTECEARGSEVMQHL